MKGDFSKLAFDESKHYHDVLMQQGRVLLDQEWNEQSAIQCHRTETGVADIIGNSGAPMHNAGFAIVPVFSAGNPLQAADLRISQGRYYVDGILVENDADVLYAQQPDFAATPLPSPLASPPEPGTYVFYLDVWLRHITALEDDAIREVALGGPDTTTRTKVVWQVKCTKVNDGTSCSAGLPSSVTAPSTGTLSAKTAESTSSTDPCGLNASGGYTRLQNQLYRVEIHNAGDRDHATFKWSRENGSVLIKCTGQEAANKNNLKVTSTGRDDLLGFKTGNWIEVINSDNDVLNTPGILAQILNVKGNVISIKPETINDPQHPGATEIIIDTSKNTRIRRWESAGAIKPNTNNSTWLELEDGVEINFQAGTFKTGDYWLVVARTAIARVSPFTAQLPQGIQHHFAQLGIARLEAGGWIDVTDCRNLFPPLTELTSLHYVGGDGQEAMPGNTLPVKLRVGVANGEWAMNGAKIKFQILSGGGSLLPANGLVTTAADADTGLDGIAACDWTLGTNTADLKLQVKASLLDSAGNELEGQLPVVFNASYSIAQNVAYNSACSNWPGAAPTNVAAALDQLCERTSEGGCCSKTVGKKDGEFKTLAEAIFKLAEDDMQDVSLCLLPGDHAIEENIDMLVSEIRFRTLHITGAEAYISMKAEMLRLQAEKLILDGFSIITSEAINKPEDPKIVFKGGSTIIDHCFFLRPGISSMPFVYVDTLSNEEATTYISNSTFLAFFSLTLADGMQGVLEKNAIQFLVLQNRNFNDYKPIGFFWVNQAAKKALREAIKNENNEIYKMTAWALTIRGNRVGAIITDDNRQSPKNMYQSLFVSENIFELGEGVFISNSFIAKHLTIVSNQFLYPLPHDNNITLAYTVAYRSVITGNMAESGNLIVDAVVVQDLIGAEPFFNIFSLKVN